MGSTFLKIKDYVSDNNVSCDELTLLPFCHITDGFSFEDIVNEGILKGQPCPILKKNAIFFFYGKPKYVPSEDAADVVGGYSPVCILYEYNEIKDNDITIFPFDSGGYQRYGAPKQFRIEDFILCSEKKDWYIPLKRYIKQMYGSNNNYLKVSLRNETKENKQNFHYTLKFIIELHDSISSLKSKKYGEQATSIEIQIQSDSIKLTPHVIFLPMSEFTENNQQRTQFKNVKEIEEKYNVKAIIYQDRPWSIGDSYTFMKLKVEEYILDTYK